MEPQLTPLQKWYEVETPIGTFFYEFGEQPPVKELKEQFSVEDVQVKVINGYGARLSADGYMDQTDWCVFPRREQAVEYILEDLLADEDDETIERYREELSE